MMIIVKSFSDQEPEDIERTKVEPNDFKNYRWIQHCPVVKVDRVLQNLVNI